MKLHLQTGPGHHEKILIEQLQKHNIEFTYSGYHPHFHFVSAGNTTGSIFYQSIRWLIWGISSRLKFLRKDNRHLQLAYSLYDYLVSKRLAKTDFLFGWAQVSLNSICKIKRRGGIAVLDYPIPHILTWNELLMEEAHLQGVTRVHSLFSPGMVARMLEEIERADYISVPSEFVKNSFLANGVAEKKLIYNSYGIDTELYSPGYSKNERFTAVFVGSVELRKGVHYLLDAFKLLSPENFELRIIGTVRDDLWDSLEAFKSFPNIKWLGQLDKISTAREMQHAHVMVMPSIAEGLSLTILESMACGTPVISTTNAGGLGVIDDQDQMDGFIIPIRNAQAIVEKLTWCFENKEQLMMMGTRARDKVLQTYRKEDYVRRFIERVLSKAVSK